MNGARVSNVVCHLRQTFLVEVNEFVKGAFSYVERTQSWNEIVAQEEAEEHKVINDPFQVEFDPHFQGNWLVLKHHVLPQETDVNELKVAGFRELESLDPSILLLFKYMLLPNNSKVRLVSQKGKHN